MKVLRQGPDKPWTYELTCPDCSSVLEIEASDINYYGGIDYPIYKPSSYWVPCPVCKAQPDVPSGKIPKATKRAAEDKWFSRNPR